MARAPSLISSRKRSRNQRAKRQHGETDLGANAPLLAVTRVPIVHADGVALDSVKVFGPTTRFVLFEYREGFNRQIVREPVAEIVLPTVHSRGL